MRRLTSRAGNWCAFFSTPSGMRWDLLAKDLQLKNLDRGGFCSRRVQIETDAIGHGHGVARCQGPREAATDIGASCADKFRERCYPRVTQV